MKRRAQKVLSLMLSMVLVVTGLTITPSATSDVQAEIKSEITSNMDNGDVGVAYYWKGESFELTFQSTTANLTLDNAISVTMDGTDAKDQFKQLEVTAVDSTTQVGVKNYTISATLNQDAKAGNYLFTVKDGKTIEKKIVVQEKDCFVPSPVYSTNTFYNNPSKSFTENFVYSAVAKNAGGKDVEFTFTDAEGASVADYIDFKVSAGDLNKFKGCVSYDVTVTPIKKVDENGNPAVSQNGLALKLHAKYKDHNGQDQEEVYDYTMLQCATAISELKLLECSKADLVWASNPYYGMEREQFLSEYPHHKDGSIYLDSTETVYFLFSLENGYADLFTNPSYNVTQSELEKIFDYGEEKQADQFGFVSKTASGYYTDEETGNSYYIMKMTAKENVSTANRSTNMQVTFNTQSAALSAIYNIFVYNTCTTLKRIPEMQVREVYKNGTYGDYTSAVATALMYNPYNQYGKYQFQVANLDAKENLIFSTGSTNNANFTSGATTSPSHNNYLKYEQTTPATLQVTGTGSAGEIIADTAATPTRPQGAYRISAGNHNIGELVLPEPNTFKIQKDTKDIISESVSVDLDPVYSLYSIGKKEGGTGAEATSNYSGYVWESSDPTVATVDKTGKVTTHKQGTTLITVRTNYGGNYGRDDISTNPVTLNVYSPISTLSVLNSDGETCKENIVAGREYTFMADKKDANGEDSTQEVEWQLADTTHASIIDAEGNAATSTEWITGDTCTVRVNDLEASQTASIKLICRATGIIDVSKEVTMTVVPEIKAQNLHIEYDQDASLRNVVGSTTTLKAKQFADEVKETVSNEKLTWSSSDSEIVKVEGTEDGSSATLTFVKTGDAVITVTNEDGTLKDSVNVSVILKAQQIKVTSDTNGIISYSDPATLTATVTPQDATDPIEWSVEPENAVTFEPVSNGVTKVLANTDLVAGTKVKVKATATDSALSNEITLTVKSSAGAFEVVGMAEEYEYTGAAITPHTMEGFQVTCNGTVLTAGTDYTVTIASGTNKEVGTSKIKIAGKNNYSGVKEIEFKIVPRSITNATVKINNGKNYTYTGSAITPHTSRAITISLPMGTTTKNLTTDDYDVTYVNNLNAGTATATITGKGNFTGTLQATFQIDPKDMARLTTEITPRTAEYSGSAVCPVVVVKDGTSQLQAGVHYNVTYTDNINVNSGSSKPTVTITGIGNYQGTKSTTFTITTATLKAENVTLSKTDYTYNGKECKPTVTVRSSSGVKLTEGTDYTITYPTDMTSVGVKSITIIGKGNFKGSVKVEYGVAEKIKIKKASIKSVKNSKSKRVTIKIKALSGVDGYEISYSTTKKFKKGTTTVVDSKKVSKTIKKLTKGKTYYFKVRGYKVNSIGRKVYGKASSVKKVKIKK